jgi:hypothetical protein
MLFGGQIKQFFTFLALLAAAILAAPSATARIWYVDRAATETAQDGQSWATAFKTLQPAIDAAHADGGGELWVAEGTYGEQRIYIDADTSRNIGSLVLREGVEVYGGFAGDETLREHRNILHHRTIIDGSHAREGEPARQVIIGASNTVLDGVEITGGDAGTRRPIGGGLRIGGLHNVRIANCIFSNNTARFGAALRVTFSAGITIERCTFTENYTDGVGVPAIYLADSVADILDSSFIANEYDGDRSDGGCVRAERGTVNVVRCHFARNTGTPLMLQAEDGSAHTVRASDFIDNNGRDGSGGLRYTAQAGAAPFVLDRCNFIGNQGGAPALRIRETGELAAGTQDFSRYLTVRNCSFINNASDWSDDPIVLVGGANFIFEHCTIAGNQCETDDAGGVIVHTSDPSDGGNEVRLRVRNSIFWNEPSRAEIDPAATSFTVPHVEGGIVRGGYADGIEVSDAEPTFLDLEFGDFRLDPASPGVDQAHPFGVVTNDVFASQRPSGLAADLGAYEFQAGEATLCESEEQIAARLTQFPLLADPFTDLDGDGLPEIASLRLLAFAACPNYSSAGHAAETAFAQNLGAAHTEPFDTRIQRRKHFIAALMSVSESLQSALRDSFAEMGVVLFNDYTLVGCDANGENCAVSLPGQDPGANHPAAGPGDFDGDGMTNAEEWAALVVEHGTLDEFIAAATNPRVLGTPDPYESTTGGGGGGGGCFIATAAFGSSMAGQLDALRATRDTHLLTNPLGSAFTDLYYRLSPPVADVIAQHDTLRATVRRVLSPVIACARWFNGDDAGE